MKLLVDANRPVLPPAAPTAAPKVLAAQERAARTGRARDAWRCPCCREICNCSGSNCQRARRQLEFTNILIHEAQSYGYKSVGIRA